MATLVQVVDSVRRIVNEPLGASRTFPDNTSGFWTDEILTDYVNLASKEVQNTIVQAFEDFYVTQTSITLVGGTIEYSMPADVMKVRRVEAERSNQDPIEVLPTTPGMARTNNYYYTSANSTLEYYLRGNQIVFPQLSANTVYSSMRFFYINRISDVSSGSSTVDIPDEFRNAVIWGAARLALHQQQSDTSKADAEFFRQLNIVKQQAERRQIQRPRSIRRTRRKYGL